MRPSYGDNAIGYVQLKREKPKCIVQARITPEHRVRTTPYIATVEIDEDAEAVLEVKCQSCTAAQGGCKHAAALLAWLYRRSEEPSPTSISCYWKKAKMSMVGSNVKFITINEYCQTKKLSKTIISKSNLNENLHDFIDSVVNYNYKYEPDSHLIQFLKPKLVQQLSLHYCSITYDGNKLEVQSFLNFCKKIMSYPNCKLCFEKTLAQSDSQLWFELRYGRITASNIYEASRCTVSEGSLLKNILGVPKEINSSAVRRGKNLEQIVLCKVQSIIKKPIQKCGILLSQDYPMIGASPDGITNDAVFEVKCPFSEKTIQKYYDKNQMINNKYRAQIQLQMLFAKKNYGYFCVASPDFEKTNDVTIIKDTYSEKFLMPILQNAINYWIKNIFKVLMRNSE